MSAQKFAMQLKEMIQEIKEAGITAIYCDNLIAYLDSVAKSPLRTPTTGELEKYKVGLQLHIEQNKNYHASQLEMFRSVITAGQNAIRSSFLLNGGASLALLAFIGHLASIKSESVGSFSGVLIPFVLGVLAMAITSGVTYLSQWLYARRLYTQPEYASKKDWGFYLNITAIILGMSSYGFFTWGMCRAYFAFISYV